MPEQRSRIAELFGHPTDAEMSAGEWGRIVTEQNCPFSSKKCFKVRKSDPGTAIGTCVVRAGADHRPLMICPNRLLAQGQVFNDVLPLLAHQGPGNEFHLLPEVQIPGGSVDYFLVSAQDGAPVDFVGIEFQTLDTTGTVWPHRQDFLLDIGAIGPSEAADRKSFGINWKMTAKTILVQLHHKTETFELLDRKLVLVLQQELLDYMEREFSFEHLAYGSQADSLHFHPYRLKDEGGRLSLALGARRSTDAVGIAKALDLGAQEGLDEEGVFTRLQAKIGDATRWRPAGGTVPPPVADVSDD